MVAPFLFMSKVMRKCFYLMLVGLIMSCSNSQNPIDDLESLVDEIEESSSDFTEEDWENISLEYEEIEAKLQQNEYTDEELKEIGKLQGRYAAKVTKAAIKETKDALETFSKQFESQMEGFIEELQNED